MKTIGQEPRVRVAGIVIEDNKLLLIAHKKNNSVYWLLPGGGVNYGESLEEALKREFLEELNITVTVDKPVMLSDSIDPVGERHIINICFLCHYAGGNYKLGEDKRLNDYSFFTADELLKLRVFPPVNEKLASLIAGSTSVEYLGKLWQKA